MKFTLFQIADISTAHITAQDGRLIMDPSTPCHLAEIDDKGGSIFWVPLDAGMIDVRIEEMKEAGLSQAFCNIFVELEQQGIPYVRFDADGAEVEGLPKFQW